MKKNISIVMTRDQVVASMAKKLADTNGSSKNQKKRWEKAFIINGVIIGLLILITGSVFSFKSPRTFIKNIKTTQGALTSDSPLSRLSTAYNQRHINHDQFALYLKDLLVRYDSLPQDFKTERPIIKEVQVHDELLNVWPSVSLDARLIILKELPKFAEKTKNPDR